MCTHHHQRAWHGTHTYTRRNQRRQRNVSRLHFMPCTLEVNQFTAWTQGQFTAWTQKKASIFFQKQYYTVQPRHREEELDVCLVPFVPWLLYIPSHAKPVEICKSWIRTCSAVGVGKLGWLVSNPFLEGLSTVGPWHPTGLHVRVPEQH